MRTFNIHKQKFIMKSNTPDKTNDLPSAAKVTEAKAEACAACKAAGAAYDLAGDDFAAAIETYAKAKACAGGCAGNCASCRK